MAKPKKIDAKYQSGSSIGGIGGFLEKKFNDDMAQWKSQQLQQQAPVDQLRRHNAPQQAANPPPPP